MLETGVCEENRLLQVCRVHKPCYPERNKYEQENHGTTN